MPLDPSAYLQSQGWNPEVGGLTAKGRKKAIMPYQKKTFKKALDADVPHFLENLFDSIAQKLAQKDAGRATDLVCLIRWPKKPQVALILNFFF